MSEQNLSLFDKVKCVPKNAIKPILAGRLRGKSDINPMWRIKVLTENFGICGFGWKYEIIKQWTEVGGNGEVAAFVNINLYIKLDGEWSDAIPGTGGSSFVANEKNGLYTSDECFKMALTDALSVSCKALGIAADIYWSEGSKYDKSENNSPKTETIKADPKKNKINYDKINQIKQLSRELNITDSKLVEWILKSYNKTDLSDLDTYEYERLLNALQGIKNDKK